ncbi:MAG: sugar phosphate isomerase/epimerase [Planctomycetota bacterium]|nr:MAG: sugar phosphate isomerase/epimerase [Planctomycetota bacterium]
MSFELSLFSISYAGLWGQAQLGVVDFVAKAAELGYPAVMLAGKRPHLAPLDTDEALLESVREAMSRHRVRCSAVAGYTDFAPQRAAEVPFLEMQFDYVTSLCRIASALDTQIVRVFTAYEDASLAPTPAWNHVVACLRECAVRAWDFGVTLAVQNHHDVALHSDALLDLIGEIDRANVKLGFDAWSPALRGEELFETARRMAPYTAITTNADYVRIPRYRYRPELVNYERLEPDIVRAVPFGDGFIDYAAFFAGLSEGGFDGPAHYEMCSPIRGGGSLENLDRYARDYVEWMRQNAVAPKS